MILFSPTTPLWFYALSTQYVSGSGSQSVWTPVLSSPLFGEWQGAYGERLSAAQSLGVDESATVRTFFHPFVAAAMLAQRVLVVRDSPEQALRADGSPNRENPNVYELWGGADNYRNSNQFLEFRVRRYQQK